MFKLKNLILVLISLTILISLIYLPSTVYAADSCNGIKLQVAIPGIGKCVKDFPTYIRTLYNFFIGIIGILAVVMIMVGGFQWLLAAGNSQKIAGAKTTILSAIMGLVLALTSYTILYIINPDLLNLKFDPDPVSLKSAAAEVYCTSNKDIFLFNDNYAMCGKVYQLHDEEDKFCMGVVCDTGLTLENTCFQYYNEYSCDKIITINDTQNGYGETEAGLLKSRECGLLIYNASNQLVYGGHCPTGSFCVINLNKGVYFSIRKDEAQAVQEVGELLGAKCQPFRGGPVYYPKENYSGPM